MDNWEQVRKEHNQRHYEECFRLIRVHIYNLISSGEASVERKIMIFLGTVNERKIVNLLTPTGKKVKNPYCQGTNLEADIRQENVREFPYKNGDEVVFAATIGTMNSPSDLIECKTENCISCKELGVTKIDTEFILKLSKLSIFSEYGDYLSSLYHEKREEQKKMENELGRYRAEKEKMKKAIERLTDEKDKKIREKESETAELQRLKEQSRVCSAEIAKIEGKKNDLKSELQKLQRVKESLRRFAVEETTEEELNEELELAKTKKPLDFLKTRLDFAYMDEILIQFMMALATNQIITLFGKPGTGKTTFVTKMAKALGARCTVISVQNNWTDSSDLLGYYSPIDKTYESTPFMEALITAREEEENGAARLHIICLDEMNLARVEYYFAEFLSRMQLEKENQIIEVLPRHIREQIRAVRRKIAENIDLSEEEKEILKLQDYDNLYIPQNIRFVATINNDDTTNVLSPKVIDRSFFIEMPKNYAKGEYKKVDTYYPAVWFDMEEESKKNQKEYESLSIFENENNRFQRYAVQMLSMYKKILGKKTLNDSDKKQYCEYMMLGKVLPEFKKNGDIKKCGITESEYPSVFKAFRDHMNSTNAEDDMPYNYLSGGYE